MMQRLSDIHLIIGFSIPKIALVLQQTQYLSPPSSKEKIQERLIDTGGFIASVMKSSSPHNEEEMKDDNRKPIWLKKYNFQSLINVPATMKKFGPLRNYWEGSMQGKGYLKIVKPKINNIKSKNWHVNAHTKILEDHVFDRVLLQQTRQDSDNCSLLEMMIL